MDVLEIQIIKVEQNIGLFYIGVVPALELKKICAADERRSSLDDLEEFIGMQRPLNKKRVKEIQKYVETEDATFPNSIILSLNEDYFEIDGDKLLIQKSHKAANILDGQHRLSGFSNIKDYNFNLIVTFFPVLSLEEQAYLFSVINTKQNKINPSLAQELYDFAKIETPQKIVYNLTRKFNEDSLGPFFHLIKRLGKRGPHGEEILSQSTFASKIIDLICNTDHNYTIRDILKKNDNDRMKLNEDFNYKSTDKIFWQPFTEKREDFIFTVLNSFFKAAKKTFEDEWADPKFIITKTTGYAALIRFFKVLFLKGYESKDLSYEFFLSFFKKVNEKKILKELNSVNYPPGVKGETRLYNHFLEECDL